MIKKIIMTSVFISFFGGTYAQKVVMAVGATHHTKMPLYIGVVMPDDQEIPKTLIHRLKDDLQLSGQFNVTAESFSKNPSPQLLKTLAERGYSLAMFVCPFDSCIDWRLYDTYTASMIKGVRYKKRGTQPNGWAHNIADAVWPLLTGQEGFFSSKIAYCKDVYTKRGKVIKYVCVADVDGSHEQELIKTPTVNVAPRWNSGTPPLLFYSEYTNNNVRLMVADMQGRRKIASNFEGINMLPTFSADGSRAVYCASRGQGYCQLYAYSQHKFEHLLPNNGNNLSPSLSADGKLLYFCSDFKTGSPQIFKYDMQSHQLQQITEGGYCVSPCYHSKRNQLAYSRMIQGTLQLMVYDCVSQEHSQLTADEGNKEEASWSPCGNYLLFSIGQGSKSRLALLNLLTHERRYLTSDKVACSYPSWSSRYEWYPQVSLS